MIKSIVFDLDNTLYDARQYFSGAFKDIAKYLSAQYGLSQRKAWKVLMDTWVKRTSAYPYLFDDALASLGVRCDMKQLVRVFNNYSAEITPYHDTVPTLRALRRREVKLGILTEGNPSRQRRKIRLLGLRDLFKVVVVVGKGTSKSSPKPFLRTLRALRGRPNESLYVADNPLLDFRGAKTAGMGTVRLLRGEFKRVPKNEDIDLEIRRLGRILSIQRQPA
ncbi:MAG: HAD-IA family hydrolase [Candidatus Bathyarchaeia archaeon]|jgi:putative hydrolase of the HAD superfamily